MKIDASQVPPSFGSGVVSQRARQRDYHEFEGSLGHRREFQASLGCTIRFYFRKMKQSRGKEGKNIKQNPKGGVLAFLSEIG